MRIKICGINSAEALAAVVAGRADYAGFVFFARSPRVVTAAQAAAIRATQPDATPTVGLFVEPKLDEIAAVLAVMPLDILQIYAEPDRAREIRGRFGRPVWLARGVSSRADLAAVERESEGLDGLVIESKPPPGATRPGGNATAIDWSLLAGWYPRLPWLLAGGLTPDNVTAAIARSGTKGVDVSSGVETHPGVKDPALITSFIEASRNAPAGLSAAGHAEYERREQGVP
ncbi:phosphoribosylanthranilate isomerase [Acidisoma cladoniae]|jgi:phosphoribosylanthranilate isomerase|uniref:phosphoribosylanthranilate isomerase n=1 Tax=Acidisoma cladoniae TaxID=3040935 RepID=UPI00254E4907|nr:phosphoribosylanthranilate isomerase [Acidisoma sp. PAMC 29798]